jgi:metallophosphoesterase (TIGR00282 family)
MPNDGGDPIRILMIADIIGKAGRRAVARFLPQMTDDVDLIVANGENAAGGFGITPKVLAQIFQCGVDVVTSGNHLWDRKEITEVLTTETRLLRPANFPPEVEGVGWTLYPARDGTVVGIVNLMGRVFMKDLDCPFRAAEGIVEEIRRDTPIILVDMHAEATSEKLAMGYWLDGRVSAVVGTHTHVATRDSRILPKGTAYMTDIGMTGPHDSVIGIKAEDAIRRFLTQVPVKFRVAADDVKMQAVIISVDPASGRAIDIEFVEKCLEGVVQDNEEEP